MTIPFRAKLSDRDDRQQHHCRPAKRRHEQEEGSLGNIFYLSADAASSLASKEEMDEDADTRGNDDNDNDNAGGIEGGGTGEVFAWAADCGTAPR